MNTQEKVKTFVFIAVLFVTVLGASFVIHNICYSPFFTGGGWRYYTPTVVTFNAEYHTNETVETQGTVLEDMVYCVRFGSLDPNTNYMVVWGNCTARFITYNATQKVICETTMCAWYFFKFVKESKLDLSYVLLFVLEWKCHD